jgi:hypothetical protein
MGNRAANFGVRLNEVGSMYARYDNPPAANRENRKKQPSIVTKRIGEITWRINPYWPEYEIATILDHKTKMFYQLNTKMFYQLNTTKAAPYKGPTEWSVVRDGRLIGEGFEPSLDDARTAAVAAYAVVTSGPLTLTRPPVEKPKHKLRDSTTSYLLMCVGVFALFFDASTAGLSTLFWLAALVIWLCEPSGML